MASKRIDELDARVVADTDLLPVTPSGGPSGRATVAAIVAEGLSQPNSASSGAGSDLSIIAADGVTSGAGGNIILEPGAQATTGGDGAVIIRQPGLTGVTLNTLQIKTESSGGVRFNAGSTVVNTSFTFSRTGDATPLLLMTQNVGQGADCVSNSFKATSGQSRISSLGVQVGATSTWGISFHDANTDSGIHANIKYVTRGTISLNAGSSNSGGGSFSFPSITTSISASQNNLVLLPTAFQRLNCTTASDITGIAPPTGGAHVDGRMIRLVNVGTHTVTLKHNSASSTAANRMFVSSAADKALAVNAWADLVYDSTDNGSGAAGWRVM